MASVFNRSVTKNEEDNVGGVSTNTARSQSKLTHEEQQYIDEEVKTRPIVFKRYADKESIGGGIVSVILSSHKMGKSIISLLVGYYNKKYKQYMGPGCQRMLQQGTLPEIEKIVVCDTEITTNRDLKHGKMRLLMKPLIDDGIIEVAETPVKRKSETIETEKDVDGKITSEKIVNIKDVEVEMERQNFEAAIWKAIDRNGSNVLIIVDSLSDYKKSLDDLQETMFKKTVITTYKQTKDVAADEKENEALQSSFNQYRNKWWHNTLIKLRTNNCWVVETIKLGETDDRFREIKNKAGEVTGMRPRFYPIWGRHTQYRVDQGYTVMDYIDNDGNYGNYLRLDWGKYEHSVPPFDRIGAQEKDQGKCLLKYEHNNRMAMMNILEDMSKDLLAEATPEDEQRLWGQKPAVKQLG